MVRQTARAPLPQTQQLCLARGRKQKNRFGPLDSQNLAGLTLLWPPRKDDGPALFDDQAKSGGLIEVFTAATTGYLLQPTAGKCSKSGVSGEALSGSYGKLRERAR